MSDRVVAVVILAEDARAANFFRRYVERAVNPRQIRSVICAGGAGEQHVRKSYPAAVKEQRRCVAGKIKNAALLVHIDADNGAVAGELQLLAAALKDAGHVARTATERIAIAVPKRNIEAWLHGLCGVVPDETYDFKVDPEHRIATNRTQRERRCGERSRPAADELFRLTRRNAPAPLAAMPSLIAAVPELRRLEH